MNEINVRQLLDCWSELLKSGEKIAKEKANKNQNGLDGRIKRTTGAPVIFDSNTFKNQSDIQFLLCRKIPQFANLINSQPEIMDGHPWIRGDFIELYFSYFRLVVEKLRRLISQTTSV